MRRRRLGLPGRDVAVGVGRGEAQGSTERLHLGADPLGAMTR